MVKIQRMITLDVELWTEARRRRINVSEACEFGLGMAINRGDTSGRDDSLLKKIGPEIAARCRTIITNNLHGPTNAKEKVRNLCRTEAKTWLSDTDIEHLFMGGTPPIRSVVFEMEP